MASRLAARLGITLGVVALGLAFSSGCGGEPADSPPQPLLEFLEALRTPSGGYADPRLLPGGGTASLAETSYGVRVLAGSFDETARALHAEFIGGLRGPDGCYRETGPGLADVAAQALAVESLALLGRQPELAEVQHCLAQLGAHRPDADPGERLWAARALRAVGQPVSGEVLASIAAATPVDQRGGAPFRKAVIDATGDCTGARALLPAARDALEHSLSAEGGLTLVPDLAVWATLYACEPDPTMVPAGLADAMDRLARFPATLQVAASLATIPLSREHKDAIAQAAAQRALPSGGFFRLDPSSASLTATYNAVLIRQALGDTTVGQDAHLKRYVLRLIDEAVPEAPRLDELTTYHVLVLARLLGDSDHRLATLTEVAKERLATTGADSHPGRVSFLLGSVLAGGGFVPPESAAAVRSLLDGERWCEPPAEAALAVAFFRRLVEGSLGALDPECATLPDVGTATDPQRAYLSAIVKRSDTSFVRELLGIFDLYRSDFGGASEDREPVPGLPETCALLQLRAIAAHADTDIGSLTSGVCAF